MLLKLSVLSSILCLLVARVGGVCVLSCSDTCHVTFQGVGAICDLIIDEAKLSNAGLAPLPSSVDMRLNLPETVTKISFILLIESVSIHLVSDELDDVTNIHLTGPFALDSDFFRNFSKLRILSLDEVVFSAFPIFRLNLKLVTLECVDIKVSSGTKEITWSFINGLEDLVSIKFDFPATFSSSLILYGLISLTRIEIANVDFSGAVAGSFGELVKLVDVSLSNAKISNLELIPNSVRNNIVELKLANNLLDELDTENFRGFNSLTKLDLSNNRFTKLVRTLFSEAPLLDTLDLSGNQIKSIETATFYATRQLRSVLLVDSLIATLDYNVLAPLVALEVFSLDGNPLICDCALFWVALFYEKFGKSFESGTNANCVAPIEQLNNKLYELDTYEMCDANYSCFCIGSGSDLECEGEYECLLGFPATNSTTDATATLPDEPTMPRDTSVGFLGLQISLLIGFLGFFLLFALCIFVVVTICCCCCCCNSDDRNTVYV